MLMGFVGCCGSLMSNMSFKEILQAVFAGVDRKRYGKQFPWNVGTLRLLAKKILRNVMKDI